MEDVATFNLSTLRVGEHAATISIEGELDLYTVTALKEQFVALPPAVVHVLVDLTRTDFVDSAGLGALVAAARRLRDRGGSLLLSVDDRNIVRTLQVSGLDRFFDIRTPETNPSRALVGLSAMTSLDAEPPPPDAA
jgi:anti-sigma B factor antagonist